MLKARAERPARQPEPDAHRSRPSIQWFTARSANPKVSPSRDPSGAASTRGRSMGRVRRRQPSQSGSSSAAARSAENRSPATASGEMRPSHVQLDRDTPPAWIAKNTTINVTIQNVLTGRATRSCSMVAVGAGRTPGVGGEAEPPVGMLVGGRRGRRPRAFPGCQERGPADRQHVDAEAQPEDRGAGGRVAPPEQNRDAQVDDPVEPRPAARLARLVLDRPQDPGDPVRAHQEGDEGQEPADDEDGPGEQQHPAEDQEDARQIGRPRRGAGPRAETPHEEADPRPSPRSRGRMSPSYPRRAAR